MRPVDSWKMLVLLALCALPGAFGPPRARGDEQDDKETIEGLKTRIARLLSDRASLSEARRVAEARSLTLQVERDALKKKVVQLTERLAKSEQRLKEATEENLRLEALLSEARGRQPVAESGQPGQPGKNKEISLPSGLKFRDLEVGTGREIKDGQMLLVHWTGWLKDGKRFGSSKDRNSPIEFVLGGKKVIEGWEKGLEGMRVGGKRKLTIPPRLAYGARGMGELIPPDATLVYEIEVLKAR